MNQIKGTRLRPASSPSSAYTSRHFATSLACFLLHSLFFCRTIVVILNRKRCCCSFPALSTSGILRGMFSSPTLHLATDSMKYSQSLYLYYYADAHFQASEEANSSNAVPHSDGSSHLLLLPCLCPGHRSEHRSHRNTKHLVHKSASQLSYPLHSDRCF